VRFEFELELDLSRRLRRTCNASVHCALAFGWRSVSAAPIK
jgi:hypothetical protein